MCGVANCATCVRIVTYVASYQVASCKVHCSGWYCNTSGAWGAVVALAGRSTVTLDATLGTDEAEGAIGI